MEQSKTTDASGGGELYDKLMALRLQAAEFADEAADNTPLGKPTSEFEASERGKAGAYYQAAQMVKAALASAPPAPTPEAGSDLAKLSAGATPGPWRHVVGDDYAIESDSYPPKATHRPCVIDSGWWLAIGNRPDDFGEANSKFIVALVNAYRAGRLVETFPSPPQAEDLAGQGEPVAWAYEWKIYTGWRRGVEFEKPCAGQFLGLRNVRPLGYLDAASAPSRPADREEIARLIRPGAFEELSPDPYGPSVELLEMGRAPGRAEALAKADAILAYLALRDAPRDVGDGWSTDMEAAPKGAINRVLVTVPPLVPGEEPTVGEAWYCTDARAEGWWWSGTSPDDPFRDPIHETNAEPVAWRHLPKPYPSPNAGDGTQDTQGGER